MEDTVQKGISSGGKKVEFHHEGDEIVVKLLDGTEIGRAKDLKEVEALGYKLVGTESKQPEQQEKPKTDEGSAGSEATPSGAVTEKSPEGS